MRTTSGLDWQARVMGANSGAGIGTGEFAPANYMGITEDASPPVDGALAGEITEGTMRRAMATFAHTSGASAYTMTRAFTADRTVTPAKVALFHLLEGGLPDYVTALDQQGETFVEGEMFTITETVTI